ncbi:MAG: response regulator [Pseudomonadota bacterium]
MRAGARVLLVDDDADVRAALGQSLELADCRVTACASFLEAFDAIAGGFTGVVVTDVRMPGRDGLDLLAQIRRARPGLPVIVLTGHGDVDMAVRALSDGAFAFLEKPCPPRKLIGEVDRAWGSLEGDASARDAAAAEAVAHVGAAQGLAEQMEAVEKHLIETALRACKGQVSAVAERLQLPRKTLYDKLRRHEIDPATFRERR